MELTRRSFSPIILFAGRPMRGAIFAAAASGRRHLRLKIASARAPREGSAGFKVKRTLRFSRFRLGVSFALVGVGGGEIVRIRVWISRQGARFVRIGARFARIGARFARIGVRFARLCPWILGDRRELAGLGSVIAAFFATHAQPCHFTIQQKLRRFELSSLNRRELAAQMSYRIIPPSNNEEAYPYRRVWPSLALQILLVTAVSAAAVMAGEALNLQFGDTINRILTVSLALLPLILWLAIAALPERRVRRPRENLMGLAILSALIAAAVGLPLAQDFFRVEQWLPLESSFQRIIGFTFTVGIVDTALKWFALRFAIYPKHLRIRSDAVAYGLASAVGYSLYLNLDSIWGLQPTFGIAAIYILSNYTIQFASSMFIALGVIESRFGNALPIALPLNLFAAAASIGIIRPLFSGVMNGPLRLAGSSDRPLSGLMFLVAALAGFGMISYFLYTVSERREREAYAGSGDADDL